MTANVSISEENVALKFSVMSVYLRDYTDLVDLSNCHIRHPRACVAQM
jgi:hypothetical protein